ncbi:MAG: nicotinate phosphoribosyltransferase, partial [Actinomycetota bacterium]|nr:nicotinate phosphoribosyltransferase [Actinomycetota bacterium]
MGTDDVYSGSGLFADLYQITMAYAYRSSTARDLEASFYLSFRENPFEGGYTVACGLEQALDHLESLSFSEADLAFLSGMTGADGAGLFDGDFIEWLRSFRFTGD